MIKPGDLVYVARDCCEASDHRAIGVPFLVREIGHRWVRCGKCGTTLDGPYAWSVSKFGNNCDCAPVAWLKRIDPLPESEDTKEREEMRI